MGLRGDKEAEEDGCLGGVDVSRRCTGSSVELFCPALVVG